MNVGPWISVVGTALATGSSLWLRQWMNAVAFACFSLFSVFDHFFPDALPWPLTYALFLTGATLIGIQVARGYRRYKQSLAGPDRH